MDFTTWQLSSDEEDLLNIQKNFMLKKPRTEIMDEFGILFAMEMQLGIMLREYRDLKKKHFLKHHSCLFIML